MHEKVGSSLRLVERVEVRLLGPRKVSRMEMNFSAHFADLLDNKSARDVYQFPFLVSLFFW